VVLERMRTMFRLLNCIMENPEKLSRSEFLAGRYIKYIESLFYINLFPALRYDLTHQQTYSNQQCLTEVVAKFTCRSTIYKSTLSIIRENKLAIKELSQKMLFFLDLHSQGKSFDSFITEDNIDVLFLRYWLLLKYQ
jgi:hypothetical protein